MITPSPQDIADGMRARMAVLEADLRRAQQSSHYYGQQAEQLRQQLDAALQRIQDMAPVVGAAKTATASDSADDWNSLVDALNAYEMTQQ